ncbi:MAG: hypothetical protein JW839_21420 [Candidatus Lokiarchaeota archaeon]|nr:hypothetical protein [Candidatus Lokiarchaeota archaeon]
MLVKEKITLEPADHAELGRLLLQKIRREGIGIRDAAIFPVSADSTFAITSLLAADEASEIHDAIWMPGDGKPPVSPTTKAILLVDAVVEKHNVKARQAKKVLGFLLKRLKLEKKLKDIKLYAPCWLSDAETREAGDGILLVPAAFAPDVSKVVPFAAGSKPTGDARELGLAGAAKELGWDLDHVYKERHEMILDKLKNELWG